MAEYVLGGSPMEKGMDARLRGMKFVNRGMVSVSDQFTWIRGVKIGGNVYQFGKQDMSLRWNLENSN